MKYGFFLVSADQRSWVKPWVAIKGVLERKPTLKMGPPGIYVTINPILRDLLAHANHELVAVKWTGGNPGDDATTSASDQCITRRRYLPVDTDPLRRAGRLTLTGVCATDAGKGNAEAVARAVVADLRGRGWPEPMVIDSGNGYAIWYPVDLPAEDGGPVQHALAQMHNTPDATVDVTVHNPSRIMRVPGTWNGKGADAPVIGRLPRMCRIRSAPPERRDVPRELIEALTAEYQDEAASHTPKPGPVHANSMSRADAG